ncbi:MULTISPECIES: SpoIIIAH-like family protein [Bacillus]|uniref:SpoIIIAH-like family protein n=1 Tax=Bacillus TaxID=1386 RepID=UPI000BB9768E|nr:MULTISPECIES: SpoIIIAH-like family protein [Bacillus]
MLLKKQTVWLLTMLSLVFVLGVYYVFSPQDANQVAMDNEPKQGAEQPSGENVVTNPTDEEADEDSDTTTGGTVSFETDRDETFMKLRLDLENLRSKAKENLEAVVANASLPADEINRAWEQFHELNAVEQKEKVLEQAIKARGFNDALVLVDGEKIRVTLKSEEKSPKLANEVLHLVRQEFTNLRNENIHIEFQTANN